MGLHEDWISVVAKEIERNDPLIVIVASRNEAMALRKRFGTSLGYARVVWALELLDLEQVLAVTGVDEESAGWLRESDTTRSKLVKLVQGYVYRAQKEWWSFEQALRVVDAFLDVYKSVESTQDILKLLRSHSKKQSLMQQIFIFLKGHMEKDPWNVRLSLKRSLCAVEKFAPKQKILLAIGGWVSDIHKAFIERLLYLPSISSVVLDGRGVKDPQDPFLFANFLLSEDKKPLSLDVCPQVSLMSFDTQEEEESFLIPLIKKELEAGHRVFVTSDNVLALRSFAQTMRVQGVNFWDGVGDFIWDTRDGQWILACAHILEQEMTPVLLAHFLSFVLCAKELSFVVEAFLRADYVCVKAIILAHKNEKVGQILSLVLEKRALSEQDPRKKMVCFEQIVELRPFSLKELEDFWGGWLAQWTDAYGPLEPILKSTLTKTIVPPFEAETLWFLHLSDVFLWSPDKIFVIGWGERADGFLLADQVCAREAPLLSNKYNGALPSLSFLRFFFKEKMSVSWHKTKRGRSLMLHKMSRFAYRYGHVLEHKEERPSVVTFPLMPERQEIKSNNSLPDTIRLTQLVELLDQPADFYFKEVLGLKKKLSVGEGSDQRDFGVLTHKVMEHLQYSLKQKLVLARELYQKERGERKWSWPRVAATIWSLEKLMLRREGARAEVPYKYDICVGDRTLTIVFRVDYELETEQELAVGDIKTGGAVKIKRLCQEIPCGWQLAVSGCAALERTGRDTVSLYLWHIRSGVCVSKKQELAQDDARQLLYVLSEKLEGYMAPTQLFKNNSSGLVSRWLLAEDYGSSTHGLTK